MWQYLISYKYALPMLFVVKSYTAILGTYSQKYF